MFYFISDDILDKARRWDELKRWERREIGRDLRRMGLTYREISHMIPVAKGTLSRWCRGLELTSEQRTSRSVRRAVGSMLHDRAVARAASLRESARWQAAGFCDDPFWVAGVVAYWAEGAKRQRELLFSNSDPSMVLLFINWAKRYLGIDVDRLSAKLHLHDGQNESERMQYWSRVTGIRAEDFRKTFIEPEATGHRKNVLYNGTILVRVSCSGDLLHRVMGWIDAVSHRYASLD